MKPRTILADDHTLVAEGICRLVEGTVDLIAKVTDGKALIEAVAEHRPDLVLLDVSMPVMNGIEAMRRSLEFVPDTKFLVVTQQKDRSYVRAALQAGAKGYVMKTSAGTELIEAIEAVMQGKFYVTKLVVGEEMADLAGADANPRDLFGGDLTPRQREVLQLVAEGKSVKEIAFTLKISPKTVEFHKAALVHQLGLHTTAELTRYALQQGIVGD